MTQPKQPDPRRDDDMQESTMHIDVEHFSVTGHVVFAGRDGNIRVTTGGDVDQNTETTITVGGVQASQQDYDRLIGSLKALEQQVTAAAVDEETREEAQFHQQTVEKQLTSEKRPNPRILVQAAKRLYRISPAIAGALVTVFSEPLVGQIVAGAGGVLQSFLDALSSTSQKGLE